MWQQIFDAALNNGLWAVLFLCLLVYLLKDTGKREEKYRATIDALTERLQVVDAIKEDTETIRQSLGEKAEAA